uniref:hypothetical protein n=1 Tax=Falsiroseomonas sp. TaxID=2870721 RepID=UPI003F702F3C
MKEVFSLWPAEPVAPGAAPATSGPDILPGMAAGPRSSLPRWAPAPRQAGLAAALRALREPTRLRALGGA